MLIYFVRHGQTDWNKGLRWQGAEADNQLNETGRAQAKAVRDWFVEHAVKPSAIISSPLQRAVATAECLAMAYDLKVQCEPLFKEVGLGEFEGKTTMELKALYGDRFDQWLHSYHLLAPPGGENLEQAIGRMGDVLLAHIQEHGDQTVIVAHQAILMAMKAALSGDLSKATLAGYKQANNEIDLWDFGRAEIRQRINIDKRGD